MPQRFLAGATGIGPDPGSEDLPKSSEQVLSTGSIADVLKSLGLDNPLGLNQPRLTSAATLASGKSLTDLLGEIFTAPGAKKLGRLRLTSYDPEKGVTFNNVKTGQALQSSMADATKLYRAGKIMREGPPTEGMSVQQLVQRLLKVLPKE